MGFSTINQPAIGVPIYGPYPYKPCLYPDSPEHCGDRCWYEHNSRTKSWLANTGHIFFTSFLVVNQHFISFHIISTDFLWLLSSILCPVLTFQSQPLTVQAPSRPVVLGLQICSWSLSHPPFWSIQWIGFVGTIETGNHGFLPSNI